MLYSMPRARKVIPIIKTEATIIRFAFRITLFSRRVEALNGMEFAIHSAADARHSRMNEIVHRLCRTRLFNLFWTLFADELHLKV